MTQIQMQHTNQRRFPHSYSSDIEQMNVEMLCAYGKELVSELLNRITTMVSLSLSLIDLFTYFII